MKHISYRPNIDGLRAIAVLSILIFHINEDWILRGFVGVDIFFAISGYLITSIIVKFSHSVNFNMKEFYRRRIIRLFPALLCCILGSIFLGKKNDAISR